MGIEELVLTIEQSKHLQELGLDMSDSAMAWIEVQGQDKQDSTISRVELVEPNFAEAVRNTFGYSNIKVTPTYTLQEILDKLPKMITKSYQDMIHYLFLTIDWNTKIIKYNDSTLWSKHYWCDNLLEASYNMLCWVIENGYLKTK